MRRSSSTKRRVSLAWDYTPQRLTRPIPRWVNTSVLSTVHVKNSLDPRAILTRASAYQVRPATSKDPFIAIGPGKGLMDISLTVQRDLRLVFEFKRRW